MKLTEVHFILPKTIHKMANVAIRCQSWVALPFLPFWGKYLAWFISEVNNFTWNRKFINNLYQLLIHIKFIKYSFSLAYFFKKVFLYNWLTQINIFSMHSWKCLRNSFLQYCYKCWKSRKCWFKLSNLIFWSICPY